MFVWIRPAEKRTIRSIPRALLFPAPGLPKGHLLLGYDDQGHCPMLADSRCSIYKDRPQTCRDYDCRIYAATGIPVDQPDIARRVGEWVFRYETAKSRREYALVRKAAAFLQKNRHLFPRETLPTQPGRLAALVIRTYRLFTGRKTANALVRAVMSELDA